MYTLASMDLRYFPSGKKRLDAEIITQILLIEKKSFPKEDSLRDSLEQEIQKLNNSLIVAFVNSTKVAGFLVFSHQKSVGRILKIAVNPIERRNGIGFALMKMAIEKLKCARCQYVQLHVAKTRTEAFNLYEKMQFKLTAEVEDYYGHQRDASLMQLDLMLE